MCGETYKPKKNYRVFLNPHVETPIVPKCARFLLRETCQLAGRCVRPKFLPRQRLSTALSFNFTAGGKLHVAAPFSENWMQNNATTQHLQYDGPQTERARSCCSGAAHHTRLSPPLLPVPTFFYRFSHRWYLRKQGRACSSRSLQGRRPQTHRLLQPQVP